MKRKKNDQMIQAEMENLAAEIEHHNRLYYQQDNPEISDAEYDALVKRYRELESTFPHLAHQDSPLLKVGAPAATGFKKVAHQQMMLSLDNAFSPEDVADFLDRVRRFLKLPPSQVIDLVAEPKIDGLSVNLTYDNGHLRSAVTRGDGQMGEDITANIQTIKDVPQQLRTDHPPILIEIRGEIYMRHADFIALNEAQEKAGERLFANPRNAAAGSVRQKNPAITATRKLGFFAYAFGKVEGQNVEAETHHQLLNLLQFWGFKVNPLFIKTHSLEETLAFYDKVAKDRASLDYEIDGVVYKVDRLHWQRELGFVGRAPRWAIAHKFPAEQAMTRLKDIQIQVGRTGILTPVAILEPIAVGGVEVKRATLHNEDEIARKDVRIGDLVVIQRAGDVIPQILSVVLSERPKSAIPFSYPDHCPECGAHAPRIEGEVARKCSGGLTCPAQAKERLLHFVNVMDIEGLGIKHIERFYEEGWLHSPADIYRLKEKRDILLTWPSWKEKSVGNLLHAIEVKRKVPLARFIHALGISQIGEETAKLLARSYLSWDHLWEQFQAASDPTSVAFADLRAIEGIGPSVAKDLIEFAVEDHNRQVIDDLRKYIEIEDYIPPAGLSQSPILNKIVVFTGTLQSFSRDAAKAKAESLGAKVGSSISKKTDYLVAGSDAGSKASKAKELGVTILSEEEWLKLIENH